MENRRKLLILGGTSLASDIVLTAQNMNMEVHVADYLQASPAKLIADKSHLVDVFDMKSLIEICEREKIDGVISGFSDMLMTCQSKLTASLGLPQLVNENQILKTTNKNTFSDLCKSYQIDVAKRYEISREGFVEGKKYIEYPVILKPSDASGGKGITICRNEKALFEAFDKAYSHSKMGKVILEQYLEGDEVSIFYMFQNGDIHLTSIADRHIREDQNGEIPLPVAYTYPSRSIENYIEKVDQNVKKMFADLGVKNGMAFIQCKLIDNRFFFYDIGLRLTGTFEYKLIDNICGYNPLEILLNYVVGEKDRNIEIENLVDPGHKKYGGNLTFLCKTGCISEFVGINEISKIPGVIHLHQSYGEGDEISLKAKGTLAQVVLRVLFSSKTEEDLKDKMDKVINSFDVKDLEGNSMLLPQFDTNMWFCD